EGAVVQLFGRKAAQSMFQLDDFPRRVVATVDNLGRAQAPSRLWPVHPSAGRFSAGPDNALRYAPFVQLVESVAMRQSVPPDARLYPQFQKAYEDLGYPRGYFNDRL